MCVGDMCESRWDIIMEIGYEDSSAMVRGKEELITEGRVCDI